ncbi:MAG: hypothetical protein ABIS29_07815 [Vicinamibacterales bacterium]
MRPNTIVGAICLIGAAAFAACQPSPSPDAGAPLKVEAQPAPPKATALKAAPRKTTAKAGAGTAGVSNAAATTDAAHASAPMDSHAVVAKQHEELTIATAITGCLVKRDDGAFQLKDNDGEHAPKARSWKSGFIKKGSANLDVVDAGSRLKLGSHVGYRVTVLGTLADREMRARSVRATSERCD